MVIRTGQQYIAGIKDQRNVIIGGERITDVVQHPVMKGPVESIARLYDLQHEEQTSSILLRTDAVTGNQIPRSFWAPRDANDLVARRYAFKTHADVTHGLMGRSPDFVGAALTAFASAANYFGQADPRFAENIRAYHKHASTNDLYLAHAAINPATDRSIPSSQGMNSSTHLKIVDRDANGIYVSGAKLLSTLAPIADELLVFPMPGYREGDEDYTVSFAIPIATKGLSLLCRETFGSVSGRDDFDHPLAKYDEMDAICVFENVLVPWDRVFYFGDINIANKLYDQTTGRHHTGHHGITRGIAKAELLVGIAVVLAETANVNKFLHVQEMLGDVIGSLELAKGAVLQAEAGASLSRWGNWTPDIRAIQAVRYHFPKMTARMIEVIQLIGAGGLLATPSITDLNSKYGRTIEQFFPVAEGKNPRDRVRLLKLAWDATGDAFGQRQMQYERYHSGDPVRLASLQYFQSDLDPLRARVNTILGTESSAKVMV